MPDNQVLTVLRAAEKILHERGWDYRFSHGAGSRLNIRSAISAACSQVIVKNGDWRPAYIKSVRVLSEYLDDGVSSWEFGTHQSKPRMRTEEEVFDLFRKVISGLEFDEKNPGNRRPTRRAGTV